MKDFQERNKFKRMLFSFPVMICILFLIVFAGWGMFNVLRTKYALDKEIARLKLEIAKAETTRKDYDAQMSEIQTADGMDREARSRFNLQKPGEEVVVFVDDSKKTAPPPENKTTGAYHAILRWFKNIFSW